ncbi:predicted protein [Verticillium alfalfae VaMs.102]|uniref:Predicted protein n=1 Tax=Verticillium alfalfae (strain VaMs.102 / ATCC MYA-4576 / FGSC 10136) TaxID=526221 RepID=C9SCM4_VERA1|nr:predicted protein [Verticillium alfalfae VaMs.102]EEY16839.1 predicted protein [Verticillium alfalfae VaMs.102]
MSRLVSVRLHMIHLYIDGLEHNVGRTSDEDRIGAQSPSRAGRYGQKEACARPGMRILARRWESFVFGAGQEVCNLVWEPGKWVLTWGCFGSAEEHWIGCGGGVPMKPQGRNAAWPSSMKMEI